MIISVVLNKFNALPSPQKSDGRNYHFSVFAKHYQTYNKPLLTQPLVASRILFSSAKISVTYRGFKKKISLPIRS